MIIYPSDNDNQIGWKSEDLTTEEVFKRNLIQAAARKEANSKIKSEIDFNLSKALELEERGMKEEDNMEETYRLMLEASIYREKIAQLKSKISD